MEEIGAGQVEVEDVPLLSLTDRAAYSIVDNIHQAWVEKGENPSHSDLVYLKLYVSNQVANEFDRALRLIL